MSLTPPRKFPIGELILCPPVFDPKPFDLFELAHVRCNQNQRVGESGSGDQHVIGSDRPPTLLQAGTRVGARLKASIAGFSRRATLALSNSP